MPRSQESQYAITSIRRLTGKVYPKLDVAFDNLDAEGLRELVRLTHDLEFSVNQATRKGAREPWRFQ